MYADTYTMRLWFQRRVEPEGEKLFQPPRDIASRRDSIDDAIEADREHMTPGRRIALGTFSIITVSSSGNNLLGGGGHSTEVMKLWGTDQYLKPEKAKR
ncbi:MAG: hypothetical protein IPG45_15740 [Deltaproteobacteria bacterium]|nr:hypothetical protein [Deltaproteobacteria bacterium]